MDDKLVSLEVDQDLVRGVLDKRIQAAIVSQLGNTDELIANAVKLALSKKVNCDGVASRYSSDNKHDFLEVMASKAIQEAAKEGLQEWLKGNKEKVRNAVLKEMKKPNRQRTLASAFANAVEESLECNWLMKCDIDFSRKAEG